MTADGPGTRKPSAANVHPFHAEIRHALRESTPFTLDRGVVLDCSYSTTDEDAEHTSVSALEEDFRTAVTSSLAAIPRQRRTNRINGITGHIAESVVAKIFADDLGYTPIQQMTGPESGGHGVDLLMMTPDLEKIISIEVKGTLQKARWPRLTTGEIAQMTSTWLDKPDNPGMDDHGLHATDVLGAVVLVNFARSQWKCAITGDFTTASSITSLDQLTDLSCIVTSPPKPRLNVDCHDVSNTIMGASR